MNQISLKKTVVETTGPSTGFTGYATGVLVAGSVECIIITATREQAQTFIDEFSVKPGDSRFSCPVALVQLKDVNTYQPAETTQS